MNVGAVANDVDDDDADEGGIAEYLENACPPPHVESNANSR